jgi:hypothetical protein
VFQTNENIESPTKAPVYNQFPGEISFHSDSEDEDEIVVLDTSKVVERNVFCSNCSKDFPTAAYATHIADCYKSKMDQDVGCCICEQSVKGVHLMLHVAKHLDDTSMTEPALCTLCKIVLFNKTNHLHHNLDVHM